MRKYIYLAVMGVVLAAPAFPQFASGVANRVRKGVGVPSAGECDEAAEVGKVYIRSDAAAVASTFYYCATTAADTYAWELPSTAPGAGESNLGSNLGAGVGVFAQKSGVTLQFKSLRSTTNLATTAANADGLHVDLTINPDNFPVASGAQAGLLSAANWTTFNNKLDAANNLGDVNNAGDSRTNLDLGTASNVTFNTLTAQPGTVVSALTGRVTAGGSEYGVQVQNKANNAFIAGINGAGFFKGAGTDLTSYSDWTAIATPASNPAAGRFRPYFKTGAGSNAAWCWLDSAGVENCTTSGLSAVEGGSGITCNTAGGVSTCAEDTASSTTRRRAQAGADNYILSASGSTTVYTGCPTTNTPAGITPDAYVAGSVWEWEPDQNGDGGATTLNICALGARPIKQADGATNPTASQIVAGRIYTLKDDGTNLRLPEAASTAAASNGVFSLQTINSSGNLGPGVNQFIGSAFYLPYAQQADRILASVHTADGANNSSLCIYAWTLNAATATLAAGTTAAAISGTNLQDLAVATPAVLAAGWYIGGISSTAATIKLHRSAATAIYRMPVYNHTEVSSGGACPASLTSISTSWVTQQQWFAFGVRAN